jgi:hypothetical protein
MSEGSEEYDYSEEFRCPISGHVFLNPVIAEDGHVYEKEMIEAWFTKHDTSPITREKIICKNVHPTFFVKNKVVDFLKKYPQYSEELYKPVENIDDPYTKIIKDPKNSKNYELLLKIVDKIEAVRLHEIFNKLSTHTLMKKFFECENVVHHIIQKMDNYEHVYSKDNRLAHYVFRYSCDKNIISLIEKNINLTCKNQVEETPSDIIFKVASFDIINKVANGIMTDQKIINNILVNTKLNALNKETIIDIFFQKNNNIFIPLADLDEMDYSLITIKRNEDGRINFFLT